MLMRKEHQKRTQEKEKILLDIQSLGVNAGCRKYNLSKGQYYDWLDRYNAHGLEGLEDRRARNMSKKSGSYLNSRF